MKQGMAAAIPCFIIQEPYFPTAFDSAHLQQVLLLWRDKAIIQEARLYYRLCVRK